MTERANWILNGGYFKTCNCETSCPCIWLQPPSEGNCKLLVAWHIESGHFNDQRLDGLNVALACYSPGRMIEGGWQAALYVDEQATDLQFDAITQIFGGKLGGHLSILMSLVSEVLGVKKVRIDYAEDGKKRWLVITQIAQAEIEAIPGITDGEATINNPPLCVVTSHPVVVARSANYQYHDYDKNWTFSDRNGFYSPFTYQP